MDNIVIKNLERKMVAIKPLSVSTKNQAERRKSRGNDQRQGFWKAQQLPDKK